MSANNERQRLCEHGQMKANWKKWGPYLSERAWGTVREDYSEGGTAWSYFPHDHARSRAYRWNEEGLLGFCDRNQYFCFAPALWNEKDPILKERLFGLTGEEGNHGEDVKEYYYYLDSSPTHSYVKMLYKYPQREYPYDQLLQENRRRSFHELEYELVDTGIFDDQRYFDVFVEYAKHNQEDILIKITACNRGPEAANIHLLPTFWCRNTWSWGYANGPMGDVLGKPRLQLSREAQAGVAIQAEHPAEGMYYLYSEERGTPLFTENETNKEKLFGLPNASPYTKEAFHRYVIENDFQAVNPQQIGTKAAIHLKATIPAGKSKEWKFRISKNPQNSPFASFDAQFQERKQECEEFYQSLQHVDLDAEKKKIQRQAFAGMLCSKQLYYYDVEQWLKGDQGTTKRKTVRNGDWDHLVNFDIISMPDKWEYPWYASWDLAFHALPFAIIDPDFAKRQLTLMTREWYMHPNGQLPAYEWNFGDVNPPVHAWATWRVYKIDAKHTGKRDRTFLQGVFNKLLLNFTWWVNRKDAEGKNIFQGGFLGLDNISIFDRSQPLPTGGHLDQADATAWMGFYCIVMMKIALELARDNPVWQDTATKFFEHFLRIAGAIKKMGEEEGLWDEEDGFFYDKLQVPSQNRTIPVKVRSLVGLLPLLAVETLDTELLHSMPIFSRRMDWFMSKRPDLAESLACMYAPGMGERRLLSIVTKERLIRILRYMLDEKEFLSPFGIRSLSKFHENNPYYFNCQGTDYSISYQPAEALSGLFGGNSNWRGPVWFPTNYLLIESLQKYHYYYGDDLKVEYPTHSGNYVTLWEVAEDLSKRLISLFEPDEEGRRPCFGKNDLFQTDPHWRDNLLFYEYFHGDIGAGIGASHQTGWTGLVAKLIQQSGNK